VAVRSKASGRQTATLDVWSGAGGVIRHKQHRRRPQQSAGEATGVNCRQRTKTSRLVRRHFNDHICSSANFEFRSRNFSLRNFFRVREFDSSRSRLVNIPNIYAHYFQFLFTAAVQCSSNSHMAGMSKYISKPTGQNASNVTNNYYHVT